MSDRTERISHLSMLFRAFIFTILVALMSGRIEAKSAINVSGLRTILTESRLRLAQMDCQENTCNFSDRLLRGSHGPSVSTERTRRGIVK